jgi:hypothetical protein
VNRAPHKLPPPGRRGDQRARTAEGHPAGLQRLAGRECHHCTQWIEPGEPHDCWTTTEAALTDDLVEDLRDAWERIRETAAEFGDQRIYASGRCIMFSRTACYFFVRPKRNVLEVCFFLGRPLKAPQVRRTAPASRKKIAHIVHVRHRDEVEPPLTDWLRAAYESSDALSGRMPVAPPTLKGSARRSSKTARPRRKTTTRRAR